MQVLSISSLSGTQTVDIPLIDPIRVRESRLRFRREAVPELKYANSLYVPSGRWPARGFVLVRRGDYKGIGAYGAVSLQIDDFKGNGPIVFKNLAIVQARCVTTGIVQDDDSIMLVELTDQRGILWNKWFQFPTTSQYNVVSPAYPDLYYTPSLDGAVPWTWDKMVGDLWGQMASFLGAYSSLPAAPSGTPQNFSFPGTSAWESLNEILDHLGFTVAVDLSLASPYTIIVDGAADSVFDGLTDKFKKNLEEDFDYIDLGQGRVPGEIIVLFHRRNEFYGTEETVRRDGLQWSSQPLYSVTVPAPGAFSSALGTGYLWDDFTVRFDVDGNPLLADVATAAAIAAQRAQEYYDRIYRGTSGYMRRIYAGALPWVTGSQVDGVRWYEDYSQGRAAWRTEITRGESPPWDLCRNIF